MDHYTWKSLDELGSVASPAVLAAAKALIATHPRSTLDHNPDWLEILAKSPYRSVKRYFCLDPLGKLVGFAPFLIHPSAFSFSYGGHDFWSWTIRRHSLTAQPLTSLEGDADEAVALALIERVRQDLCGGDVLFMLGLRLDSAMARVIERPAVRRQFEVMPHGPTYQRRLARVESSVDDYVARLGPKTRQELRRQERRLLKEVRQDMNLSVYTDADSVHNFLRAVESVSRRTYQWNLHGLGIKNDDATRHLLQAAAVAKWFRGYVLFFHDKPLAFMLTYLYRASCLSVSIGYDPDWSKWSVGNVLHLQVMRDLATLNGEIEWFDFMYGDNPNKARLSTDAFGEQNYYLIPRTARSKILITALRTFDGTTYLLSRALDQLGLRKRLRRLVRSQSTQSARAETRAPPGESSKNGDSG